MPGLLTRGRQALDVLFGRSSVRNEAPYEAASQARRLATWRPPTVSPNGILLSLSTLRDRSRAATRNDGYAKGVIDKLVTNLIGTGIKPLSQAADPEFRKTVQALWLRWTDESDADGLLDFYGQQAQAARVWLEAGDVFARMRSRFPGDMATVPLQVQVLEPELCPHTYNGQNPRTGNKIRAGIEITPIGRRIAYHFHPSRPDQDGDFDPSQLVVVPANTVVHLFDPLRAGQLRGLPILTQALIKLHELDKYDDATLLRQQIANLFALFITRDASHVDGDQIHPLTGLPVDDASSPMVQMEPGTAQELNPGEDVKFSDPPDPPTGYADFMRQQLRAICVAVGVPYEVLTGDMSGMNDRTVRVVLNEFKRRMQAIQHNLIARMFCRPIWEAWMDAAVLSGALPVSSLRAYIEQRELFTAVKWMPARWAYLHPVQDVEADQRAILAGFTTRSAVVSEYGEDSEQIDAEQAADNARADALGLLYASDGRVANTTSTFSAQVVEDIDPPAKGAAA